MLSTGLQASGCLPALILILIPTKETSGLPTAAERPELEESASNASSKLLDLEDFCYLHRPAADQDCQPGPLFLFLVHSRPSDFARRRLVRETWGSADKLQGTNRGAKVVFLMGRHRELEPRAKAAKIFKENQV